MQPASATLHLLEKKMSQLTEAKVFTVKELEATYRLFSLFFEQLTEDGVIAFTTLYARVSFVGVKGNLPSHLLYDCQYFRRRMEKGLAKREDHEALVQLGLHLIQAVSQHLGDYEWSTEYLRPSIKTKATNKSRSNSYHRIYKAILLDVDGEGRLLSLIHI